MFNLKRFTELFIFIFSFILRKQPTANTEERLKITLPSMDALTFNENKHKCILLMRDGRSITKNLNNEYRITNNGIFLKIKGRWVKQPDVVGISFFLEN